MNTQVNIDAQLLRQAMQVTHVASTQELLERVLRQVVENPVVAKTVSNLPQVEFSASTPLEALIKQQGAKPSRASEYARNEGLDL